MKIIRSKDDVLTVLIHLGYLSYDGNDGKCYIPNKEVSLEFTNAVEDTSWSEIVNTIRRSEDLLEATLRGDADAVAKYIDQAHDENTSILSYNDESSLGTAIYQIKQKKYPAKLAEYSGEIILVGISYDREKKTHECVTERI